MKKPKLTPKFDYKGYSDELWYELVKAKAGYKCEISGATGTLTGGDSVLNAHHIAGKPNLVLRYLYENGISVTQGIHKFTIHNPNRAESGRNQIKAIKGDFIFERLKIYSKAKSGSIKLYALKLEQDLAEVLKSLPDNIKKARLDYLLADKRRNKPIRDFLIKHLTEDKCTKN